MSGLLRVFVYGTLKVGGKYHERFAKGVVSVKQAWLWGRLYHLVENYPALEVPKEKILEHGSQLFERDRQLLYETKVPSDAMSELSGGWIKIEGELMEFTDAEEALASMDWLEDFDPEGECAYRRELMAVEAEGEVILCWVYVGESDVLSTGEKLEVGAWTEELMTP